MLNLENVISEWKKSLYKNPSLEDGYIEELASHLRDKIETLINSGMNEEEAFEKAEEEIGQTEKIGAEYFKNNTKQLSGKPSWQAPVWMPELIFNYIKISLRSLKKNTTHSFINVFSLALSIVCFLFILLYINQELSYDKYIKDNNRVFMVAEQIKTPSDLLRFARVGWPVAPALKNNFPQVEYTARIYKRDDEKQIQHNDKIFYESDFIFAENNLFNILTFDLLQGNPKDLLTGPNTIVITDKISKKYFGNENPVGKILKVNDENFTVTGVIKSLPENSSLKFNFVASLKTIEDADWFSNWTGTECYTYIKLNKNVNARQFEQQMTGIAHKYDGEELKSLNNIYRYHLIPISEVHWQTKYDYLPATPGNIENLLLFGAIALLILLIAAINYMNLATAKSMMRAKEVGLRKVLGAVKKQLMTQFLGESLTIVTISALLGTAIVFFIIPYLNNFSGTIIERTALFQPRIILLLLGIIVLIGFVAGMYPALVISGFRPITVLRGKFHGTAKGKNLRKILVVFQFAVTVLMLVGTIVIDYQINFMKSQDLGFKKEHKLVVPALGLADLSEKYRDIKNAMLSIPDVKDATVSSTVPGKFIDGYNIILVGHEKEVNQTMDYMFIDPDFVPSYGLKIIAGRNFSNDIKSDEATWDKSETSFLINEEAMKRCGWSNPKDALGKYLITGYGGRKGKIIGVVKDFHYEGLQTEIKPVVFEWFPEHFRMLTLNVSSANLANTIQLVKNKWKRFFPNALMNSFFLNSEFNQQYIKEEQTAKLAGLFTLIGIIIACSGLLGLVSFIVEQKTKEIGIRKALGASSANILRMLTGEFIKWVFIGNLVAWPVAYFLMKDWLQNFAYRININLSIFLIAFLISVFFAFVTILYKAFRASIENPIKSLRYE